MADNPNIDASFEKALRALLQRHERPAEGCPDPGVLSAYYERALAEDELGAIEGHLAACVDCQAELALLARLDPGTPAVLAEEPRPAVPEKPPFAVREESPPAVELKAEQLEPEPAEEPEETAPEVEQTVEEGEQEPVSAAPHEFIPAPRRSRWRWVAPMAIAATAVIAVSVTYRFAVEDASRRGLELQSAAPPASQEAPPSLPEVEPNVKAPPVEDEPRTTAQALGGAAGKMAEVEQDKAAPAAPPPPAPAIVAPQPQVAAKAAPGKKEDGAANLRSIPDERLARSEKPAAAESAREKSKSLDEEAAGFGARAAAEPQAAVRVPARGAFVVASRTNERQSWRFTGPKIERTDDGGRSWQTQTGSAPTSFLAASAPSGDVCWAVGQGGVVMRTTDGKTWQSVAAPTSSDLVHVSAWSGASATVKSADGSRFSTDDGGATWSKR